MNRLRRAAKATLVAQLFNWASLVLSIVTIPLYLSWLGQERYGLILTALAFAAYLMFSDGGINWASMLLISEANGRKDKIEIAAIMRTSFPLAAGSAILVALAVTSAILVLRNAETVEWLPDHPEFPGLIFVVGLSVILNLGMAPYYNLLTGLQQSDVAAIYQGSGRLFGTLGSLGVASTGASLGWVYGANVIAAMVFSGAAAFHCRRTLPWAFVSGPYWDSERILRQLRVSAKSLIMQIGLISSGTAPVLAISFAAGPQFVPCYSILLALLNVPLGFISSFGASIQAGYGEAMGNGELHWIAATLGRVVRLVLIIIGIVGTGFVLLSESFVELWTEGRILVSQPLLISVLAIASTGSILTSLRYALTGINRHKRAAFGELLCGVLSIILGVATVKLIDFSAIGLGITCAILLTTGWLFPMELKRALGEFPFLPDGKFLIRLIATTLGAALAGMLAITVTSGLQPWLMIAIPAISITITFCTLCLYLLPNEARELQRLWNPG